MSTLVSLFLVLAAIGVAAFLVKRLSVGNSSQARLMRVVSQLPLGAREKISIVELDDQWLVLGVTAQQITLLAQTARKESGTPPVQALTFSKLFDLARGKHDKA
jgi:flagellar protein FliO/FliZ